MILKDTDRIQIQERLKSLKNTVRILLFTQKVMGQCQFCSETESLLKAVCGLSDNLNLEVKSFVNDAEMVEKFNIDKIPATVILGQTDHNIRFFGIPSGYEFATFLETCLLVSGNKSGLTEQNIQDINQISKDVQIQVFVTPTCPYCPRAAFTAIQFAIENPKISASIVEISEFPHIAQKYSIMGVPKIVINEEHAFEGALPENLFLSKINEALQ